MHHGIFLSGVEYRGHWPWTSRSFWPFRLRIVGNLACSHNNRFELESSNLHQICIVRFAWVVKHTDSVPNYCQSVSPKQTTLEEDRELFKNFSSILCLWFDIQGRRTDNFFLLSFEHWYWGHQPWPSRSYGHFESKKWHFNVALVYWFRPAKGYYTSQRALVNWCHRCVLHHNWYF